MRGNPKLKDTFDINSEKDTMQKDIPSTVTLNNG